VTTELTSPGGAPRDAVRAWLRRQGAAYRHGEERPLGGYAVLMSAYAAGTGLVAGSAGLLRRRRGVGSAELPGVWDVAVMTLATQRLTRTLAKDPVTSPLRAPFTSFAGLSAPGELAEEVRGHGLQHSMGELLTCPMCLSQWVATAFSLGFLVAPTVTRRVAATFAVVGGADFLQQLYAAAQQLAE
jgi:hypothetical protein